VHFGTILVDLERRRVVDGLAVRTGDAVTAWRAARPGIQIVSPLVRTSRTFSQTVETRK